MTPSSPAPARAATLRDVAREAGVSISTVSRVLNGQPFVRPEVRDRVVAASKALGYQPDVAARSMRTGTTGTVGLLVSDISNPLFASIAGAADLALSPRGYALVLANSANDPDHEAELISTLRQRRLDGLIIAAANEQTPGLLDRIRAFQAAVLLDREIPGANVDTVCSDHAAGLADAIRHLARLGHRRIALIAGTTAQRGSRVRLDTYRRELAALGLDRDEELCRDEALTEEDGRRALEEILALPKPPTAVIAGNNQIFAGLFAAIRDLGIDVPRELSLVACEETELTALHNPPLDVVRRDVAELGRVAAELLLSRLESPARRRRAIMLPAVFEARASSAPPPRTRMPRRGRASVRPIQATWSSVGGRLAVHATADGSELLLFSRDLGGPATAVLVAALGRALVDPAAAGVADGRGVGVAVPTPDGVAVVAVEDAATAPLPRIRSEVERLVAAAQAGRHRPAQGHAPAVVLEDGSLGDAAAVASARVVVRVSQLDDELRVSVIVDPEWVEGAAAESLLRVLVRLVERPYRRLE